MTELYHGCAEDILPTIKRADAIIIDPPYELSDAPPGKSHYGMSLRKFEGQAYADITNGFDLSIFLELERICQPFNMFCFCSNKQISKIMQHHEEKGRIVNLLVWHKINAAPFANGVWRGDIEYIIHARDNGAVFQGNAEEKRKVSSYPIVQDSEHPTVKPLQLIQKFVQICTTEGQTVLDCYMGSGTTGIACVKTGRNFIGIEKEEKYFNLARQRITDTQRQPDFFHPPTAQQGNFDV